METRSASRPSHPDDALDWSGKTRSARLARVNKPLRCRPLEGRRDQKSPLRRCFRPRPPLRTRCAGFASGCQSSVRSCDRGDLWSCDRGSGDLAPGGCPASCPDAHRPTHGHRHVRNWARAQLGSTAIHCKRFLRQARKNFARPARLRVRASRSAGAMHCGPRGCAGRLGPGLAGPPLRGRGVFGYIRATFRRAGARRGSDRGRICSARHAHLTGV